MIRASLCLMLILVSMLAATPAGLQIATSRDDTQSLHKASGNYSSDPNGSAIAFNITYSHFDLYTKNNATSLPDPPTTPGNLTWLSKFNNQSGAPIPNTAFNYTLGQTNTNLAQLVNYTLTIPGIVSPSQTFLTFKWTGTLNSGTTARYLVYNGTDFKKPIQGGNSTKGPGMITGGPPFNSTDLPPFPCGTTNECILVSKYAGFNLTLSFVFNSNATGRGITVLVSNVIVASLEGLPIPSSSHVISVGSNMTEIHHTAQISLSYNATVTYPKPNSNQTLTHIWRQVVTTFYMPESYRLDSIKLNDTGIFPVSNPVNQGPCELPPTAAFCTRSVFLSLNMTMNKSRNSTATIRATTINAISSIQTALGGVATYFWSPGDKLGIKVSNQQGVNVTGSQIVWLTDPTQYSDPSFNTTVSSAAKLGTFLYNLTQPLPEQPLGKWNVTVTFLSGYDLGFRTQTFKLDEIRLNSFGYNGGAGHATSLNVHGTLGYASGSPAGSSIFAEVFAVDTGSPSGPNSTKGSPFSDLYISNVTFVNGVFTENQPLIIYFTIVNPTTQPQQPFSANMTIEHEWSSGQTHGVNATFTLTLGDEPFLVAQAVYRVDLSLTVDKVRFTVQSLSRQQPKPTYDMAAGASPVPSLRQHFGLFKFTVTSKNLSTHSVSSHSVESPTYAYLLYKKLIPSKLLAYGPLVIESDESFSATISSDRLLGAKKLAVFILARDSDGIVLGDKDHDPTNATDSTIVLPTVDVPSEVVVKQIVNVKIQLKSNSMSLSMALTVNLDIPGTNITKEQTTMIDAGKMIELSFAFTAPSNPGPYTVVFSSPEYGASLVAKTLQVSLVQSSLQVLIPAIIGLIAALVVLGVYLVKRSPQTEVEPTEKPKPAPGKPAKPPQGPPARNP